MLNTGRKAMLRSREEKLEILHDDVGKSGVGVGMHLSWLKTDEYRHQQVVRGDGIWQTPKGAGGSGTGKVSLPCFGGSHNSLQLGSSPLDPSSHSLLLTLKSLPSSYSQWE